MVGGAPSNLYTRLLPPALHNGFPTPCQPCDVGARGVHLSCRAAIGLAARVQMLPRLQQSRSNDPAWRGAAARDGHPGLLEEVHLFIAEGLDLRDRWSEDEELEPLPCPPLLPCRSTVPALQGPPGGLLHPAERRFSWLVPPPAHPG